MQSALPGAAVPGQPSSITSARPVLSRIRTDGFAGYALKYSPFFPGTLAVASSQNFGLVGNGRLHVLNLSRAAPVASDGKRFDTQDGLFDLAWSEVHENQLVTGSGDGSVKLWDIALNDYPIRNWHEHTREIFCVDWSNIRKDLFASSSWDHSVKLWSPERPQSLSTINAHSACVYAAVFSPHMNDTLASCSSDGLLKVWDLKTAGSNPNTRAALTIPAHPTEILSLDWNKYQPSLIATGSVDRTVRVHDIRMASNSATPVASADGGRSCIATLIGHDYAIRRVAWSPHAGDILASSGYDMTARVWKLGRLAQPDMPATATPPAPPGMPDVSSRCTDIYADHREFVTGLSWSLFEPGVLATASWDQECHVFVPNVV